MFNFIYYHCLSVNSLPVFHIQILVVFKMNVCILSQTCYGNFTLIFFFCYSWSMFGEF